MPLQASDRRTVKVGKTQNTVQLILLRILVFPPHTGMGVAPHPLHPCSGLKPMGLRTCLNQSGGQVQLPCILRFSYFDRATIRLLIEMSEILIFQFEESTLVSQLLL